MLIAQHKWMFAAVVVAAALAPASAYADPNEIKAVAFSEDNGTTKVILRGAQTPTFTVYKLERPSRVVVDVPQARLAEALRGHEGATVFTPSTWAVSTIAAQQLDDGGQMVRVIVTLARPGRYDVKTEGNQVVVAVSARDPMPKGTNPAELAKLKAETDTAKADANTAKAEAERMRKLAAEKQAAVELAMQDSARTKADVERMKADANRAKAEADAAKQKADRALAEVNKAQAEVNRAHQDATRAKQDAMTAKADAERARTEAEQAKREVEQARAMAAKSNDAATRARLEAEAQAKAAKADAAKAQAEAAKMRAEAVAAREEAEKAKREARSEADAAKAEAARARSDARAARLEAEAAKAAAAADKRMAEADKQRAEQERAAAMQLQKEAKAQLAQLDKKALEVQVREDKARAAAAAAQVREDAARDSLARAERERAAAEQAAKIAAAARDKSSSMAAAEREKLIAEANAAEARLAAARKATADAEARRIAAETAAKNARSDLDKARTTLASVEDQRTAAERAASEATRKRSEAEAAATDAARRRSEAEAAAAIAASKKGEAERAAREAQIAKAAAEKQRTVAEAAATKAVAAKHQAEASLEQLMAKREAAERAAADLELRSKQEAKAAADLVAAQQRKASEAELAKVRAEVARLADQRKNAEAELADRRKAVASQQAEADRLRTAAAAARDTAEREEKRRASLAAQRATEEAELARIKAAKAVAAAPAPAVAPAPAPLAKAVPPAAVTKPAAKAAFIKDISFKGDASNGRVDLAMTGEGRISLGEVTSRYVELIIDNTELAQKLERKLDVSKFGSPVRAVSSYRDRRTPNRVRLVAELAQPATPTIERGASGVVWSFASTNVARAQAKPSTVRTQNIPPQVVGGFGAASTPIAQQSVTQVAPQAPRNRKVYRGATVDFDFKDAPMSDLLRTIAETGRVNIVVPDGVDAKVTVRLRKVPWDQALEVILASHGLWYRRDGNLFRIAPRKELDAEDEAEAARREAMIKSESPRSEIIPLNYASAAELKPKLETMLSSKGRLEVDPRTNSLIVSDVAGNRNQISQLALSLDLQTPQISIEARIVEARSTFLRQFGIQWGGNATASAAGGNATGLVFPSSIGVRGGAEDTDTPLSGVSATPSDFAVNLPAAVGTGSGGALGLSLGSVAGNFNINLRLSALEDTGTVRIISAPKITVLNNKEATISQGVSIPISVVSAAGTQTQFVQADLALKVTPNVSQRDCAISMDLQVTKNEPDFVNVGARGDPSILRKEAKTTMLVKDGETSVLGGIYTRNTGLAYSKVPLLGDIPVLGWLFKTRRENDDRTEILVFITPKITNRSLLRCVE